MKFNPPTTIATKAIRLIVVTSVLAAAISTLLFAYFSTPVQLAAGSQGEEISAQGAPSPTPAPTATPGPDSDVYRNTTEGFSLQIPTGWTGESSDPPRVFSALNRPGSATAQFDVWVERVSTPQLAREWISDQLDGYAPGIAQTDGQTLIAADGTTAHQSVIEYTNSNGVPVREMWAGFGRGTQIILVRAYVRKSSYPNVTNELAAVFSSFAFESPAPFGASQSDSLFLYGGEIRTLDPVQFRGSADSTVGALFNGLVELTRDLEVAPAIAKTWVIDDTGTVYTFHIDPDAKFHDGTPITANDVKYSFERAADPATESPTVRTYLGDIVGIDEMVAGEATEVSGLEVIDDLTLRVTIDSAKAYFIQKLTYPTAYIVDRRNVESGDDWTKTPNGSGRFKLKTWDEDELLILERFDDHHRGAPKLKHIVYRLFAGRSMSMYEQGEIDMIGVGGANIDRVNDPQNILNKDLVTGTAMCTSYLYFNSSRPPFDDIDVRRAFATAIDMETILDVNHRGHSTPAHSILPPGMPGHTPDRFTVPFEPDSARRLLRDTEYYKSGLFDEPLHSFSGNNAFHWMWQTNLGIDIIAVSLPDSDDAFKRRDGGEIGFGISGWCADYPDPQNFLEILFHSDSDENVIGYSNLQVDALLDRAAAEPDRETRLGLYSDAEELILADWAVIPVSHHRRRSLVKPYVGNFVITPIGVQIFHELEITR